MRTTNKSHGFSVEQHKRKFVKEMGSAWQPLSVNTLDYNIGVFAKYFAKIVNLESGDQKNNAYALCNKALHTATLKNTGDKPMKTRYKNGLRCIGTHMYR